MSKQLYEEALAEVRQLKQIAESNAKKAIMDEVEPRIKQLIESQLINGSLSETEEVEENDRLEPPKEDDDRQVMGDEDNNEENFLEMSPAVEGVLKKMMPTLPERLREFKILTHRLGTKIINESNQKNYSTLLETLKAVYVLLQERVEETSERQRLEETLDSYYKVLLKQQEIEKMNPRRGRGLSEASLDIKIDGFDEEALDDDALDNLKVEIIPSADEGETEEESDEEGGEEDLEDEEEGGEEDVDLDLGGEEEGGEEGEGEEDLGLEDEEEESETKMEGKMYGNANLSDDTVVEIDEGMLRREIARMKALREEKEAAPVEKKSVKGKKMTPKVLSAFGGGTSEGDAWLDGEVTTEGLDEYGVDELESEAAGCDEEDEKHESYNEMDELDELMGHDEETDEAHTPVGGAAALEADDMDEMVEASEEETDEVHDMDETVEASEEETDEGEKRTAGPTMSKGRKDALQPNVQSDSPNESRLRLNKVLEARKGAAARAQRAARIMESARKAGNKAAYAKAKKVYTEASSAFARATEVAKALNESLKRASNRHAAAETAALRKQLAETNLFNAKLLYTNKLLQNDALTPRQKVTIIEKLDEARSLREAKLVYESLTRTISSGKERIAESASSQVLGSASRATRSGSTVSLNEGVETARWARLAGITK